MSVNRFWLNLSLVCFGICSAIAIYLIFVFALLYRKSWERTLTEHMSPRAIPAAWGSGVVLCISIHRIMAGVWFADACNFGHSLRSS